MRVRYAYTVFYYILVFAPLAHLVGLLYLDFIPLGSSPLTNCTHRCLGTFHTVLTVHSIPVCSRVESSMTEAFFLVFYGFHQVELGCKVQRVLNRNITCNNGIVLKGSVVTVLATNAQE